METRADELEQGQEYSYSRTPGFVYVTCTLSPRALKARLQKKERTGKAHSRDCYLLGLLDSIPFGVVVRRRHHVTREDGRAITDYLVVQPFTLFTRIVPEVVVSKPVDHSFLLDVLSQD